MCAFIRRELQEGTLSRRGEGHGSACGAQAKKIRTGRIDERWELEREGWGLKRAGHEMCPICGLRSLCGEYYGKRGGVSDDIFLFSKGVALGIFFVFIDECFDGEKVFFAELALAIEVLSEAFEKNHKKRGFFGNEFTGAQQGGLAPLGVQCVWRQEDVPHDVISNAHFERAGVSWDFFEVDVKSGGFVAPSTGKFEQFNEGIVGEVERVMRWLGTSWCEPRRFEEGENVGDFHGSVLLLGFGWGSWFFHSHSLDKYFPLKRFRR